LFSKSALERGKKKALKSAENWELPAVVNERRRHHAVWHERVVEEVSG